MYIIDYSIFFLYDIDLFVVYLFNYDFSLFVLYLIY